jgi:hypothetical protein
MTRVTAALVSLLLGAALAVPGVARAVTDGDSVGDVAIGGIAGNASLGMAVGRAAGMGAGYIYSKSQESD